MSLILFPKPIKKSLLKTKKPFQIMEASSFYKTRFILSEEQIPKGLFKGLFIPFKLMEMW